MILMRLENLNLSIHSQVVGPLRNQKPVLCSIYYYMCYIIPVKSKYFFKIISSPLSPCMVVFVTKKYIFCLSLSLFPLHLFLFYIFLTPYPLPYFIHSEYAKYLFPSFMRFIMHSSKNCIFDFENTSSSSPSSSFPSPPSLLPLLLHSLSFRLLLSWLRLLFT